MRLNEVYSGGRPPSRKSLTTNPKVTQFPFVKEFMELAQHATTDPNFTKFAAAREESSKLLVQVLLGELASLQALQESERVWNSYLAQSE